MLKRYNSRFIKERPNADILENDCIWAFQAQFLLKQASFFCSRIT